MKSPPVFHLPGWSGDAPWRHIEATRLRVPALDASGVGAVSARLRDAARALRRLPLDERVQRIAAFCGEQRRHGAGEWRQALATSAGLSPQGLDAAWEATFAPVSVESLHAALRAESLHDGGLEALAPRLPDLILHVLSGNVLAPTLQTLIRGWLLGSAQWLRPAAREPLFAAVVAARLRESAPELAACTAVLWWPHASRTESTVVGASDCVTIQGQDASVAEFERRVAALRPRATFVGYGARWSAALLSAAAQDQRRATALAHDVALFDQQGCLSPTLAFVERSPRLHTWCETLARALAQLETRLPRGPLSDLARAGLRHWHEATRLQHVLGRVEGFWEDSIQSAVALTPDAACLDSPLDRHLVVVSFEHVDDLARIPEAQRERLQGLGIALDGWDAAARRNALRMLGASRVADVGTLQLAPPEWCQDHKPPLASLFRSGVRA